MKSPEFVTYIRPFKHTTGWKKERFFFLYFRAPKGLETRHCYLIMYRTCWIAYNYCHINTNKSSRLYPWLHQSHHMYKSIKWRFWPITSVNREFSICTMDGSCYGKTSNVAPFLMVFRSFACCRIERSDGWQIWRIHTLMQFSFLESSVVEIESSLEYRQAIRGVNLVENVQIFKKLMNVYICFCLFECRLICVGRSKSHNVT